MAYPTTTLQDVIERLDVLANVVLANKPTMSVTEVADYVGVTRAQIYKFTSEKAIPHFKPRGKLLYFDRAEIDDWLKQNRVKTIAEVEKEASSHVALGAGG